MPSTLTLDRLSGQRLAETHGELVRAAINRYRAQAKQMLKLARLATRERNGPLALGYLELAQTYRAMASGLQDQSNLGDQQS